MDAAAIITGVDEMKKTAFVGAVVAALAALIVLSGCGRTFDPKTQSGQTTEERMTERDGAGDAFELSLYTDPKSDSFMSLSEPVGVFTTGIGTRSDDRIRFVSNTDGVTVSLVKLRYDEQSGELVTDGVLFTVKVKKGEVYEFDGYLAETVPPAVIEAQKGDMKASRTLTYDGRDGKTDFVLAGQTEQMKG